jgi:hypothetical protein
MSQFAPGAWMAVLVAAVIAALGVIALIWLF